MVGYAVSEAEGLMVRVRRIRLMKPCAFLFFFILPAVGLHSGLAQAQVAPNGKNVLILHAFEANVPIFELTDRGLRAVLDAGGVGIRNQFFEYLDLARNPSPEHRAQMAKLMRLRYGHRKIDVIITMYAEAFRFVLDEGSTIFPNSPIVALWMPVGFELPKTGRRVIQHIPKRDMVGTLEIALKLLPDTKRVYVVAGVYETDRAAEEEARREFKKWEGRLEFRYLSNMPLEEILTTVSSAPPGTVVLILPFTTDVTGRIFTLKEVSQRVSRVSTGPVFGLYEFLLGQGIVGGSLLSYELIGTRAGEMALDILRGIRTTATNSEFLDVPPVPMFDWRQLKHWNLNVDALPEGSILVNKELTLWDLRYYIIGALAFIGAETLLMGVLLVQRRRRLQAEGELREHKKHLEHLVRERTAELVVAKDQAVAANKAKSVFLATMSHELRTPLNSILGLAQLMERDSGFLPRHADNLRILSRSGRHLLELIDDVLELSRIEADKIALVETRFDLHQFLDDVERMMRPRAEKSGLELICESEPGLPKYVRTDARKLRQILINLLGNAIRYTEKGHVKLTMEYNEDSPTASGTGSDSRTHLVSERQPVSPRQVRGRLKCKVEDTGIGIAEEDLERIFEPFVQLHQAQGASGGTGLGLALSRRFAALLGGTVIVTSEVGKGSTFQFETEVELPGGPDVDTHPTATQVVAIAPGQPEYRILVVDDSDDNRSVLRQLLEQVGFSVLEATSGHEAVDLHATRKPHLILLDLRMPVMDGHEAARRIRKAEGGRRTEDGREIHTPIIAVSAGAIIDAGLSQLSSVFDDVARKPFEAANLLEKIGAALGVEYVYRTSGSSAGNGDENRDAPALKPVDLAVLSAEWLAEFSRTLRRGWSNQLLALVDQIPPEHGELARALADLVRIHAYDKLIAVTKGALEEPSHG
jgi:signal transduction histidine kinase/CheY-like chemotaxis protein